MSWVDVATHLLAVYAAGGAWCGYRWTRDDGASIATSLFVGLTMGVLIAPLFAVFGGNDSELADPLPKKRTLVPAATRQELKRLRKIERDEEARVTVLELNAAHRVKMAEFDERRKKAEEIA